MMELVNQELQLQAGEENVTKGLLALNVAQDYFESLAAQRPQILGYWDSRLLRLKPPRSLQGCSESIASSFSTKTLDQ